jgi:aromatic-L-amino-acid decarboxylase
MLPDALEKQLFEDVKEDVVGVAIVANAGTTSTGAIDQLDEVGALAKKYSLWFHVDGAYGLPGILDPEVKPLYRGLELADSVIVDPHKWLGAPVGIGATFVRDRSLLHRAFAQGASDYLEGSCSTDDAQHSMDKLGIPYHDFGVELSAPSRGVVVWAMLMEIGRQGLAERVQRHNAMARQLAHIVEQTPELELMQQPTLSICCFRYVGSFRDVESNRADLNELNNRIHRQLVHNSNHMPSTVMINGKLAIRPCYIGARADMLHVNGMVEEVLAIGRELSERSLANAQSAKN